MTIVLTFENSFFRFIEKRNVQRGSKLENITLQLLCYL